MELTTALVTERPMPRGPPMVMRPWWQDTTPTTQAKMKLLKTPLTTSFTSTTSRKPVKKAAKEISMRLLALETNAPPSQATKIEKTTSMGKATAIAAKRGSTR